VPPTSARRTRERTLTFSGTNTYSGATTISGPVQFNGTQLVDGGITLDAGGVALLVRDGIGCRQTPSPSAPPAAAHWCSMAITFTLGAVANNATLEFLIIENASATPATLSIGTAGNSTFAGVIQDGAGGGALGLNKSALLR